MNHKVRASIILLLISTWAIANDDQPIQMADAMRSNGKIYVVVAVLLTVLAGLFLYLWRLDKRITKLEKSDVHS